MATILVVDDSALDRRLAGGLLEEQAGWKIQYAENGAEALERVDSDPPDLILTDLQMPVMDGLQLVAAIKERYPLVPVILMTAKGSETIAMQALRAGAASYTPKRKLADDLVETVRGVLSLASQQRDRAQLMEYQTSSAVSFALENDAALIAPLINMVQERVIHAGLHDPSEQIRMAIALEEALVNAVFHGNLEISSELRESEDNAYYKLAEERRGQSPYRERRLYLEARRSADELALVVRDDGPGYDPAILPDPRDPANLERASGRGLLLIRTFMDDVRHNDKGNEITMVKRLGAAAEQPA
jgi:CheY-like chemotaxis protein